MRRTNNIQNKKMKLLKHGLFALLALLSVACTQDSQDAPEHIGAKPEASTKISLEGLSFSLDLDSEEELRHIGSSFDIVNTPNSKGQLVPFPTFQDGQKVPLTVAIANEANDKQAYLATSATYEAASKRLLVANGEYKLVDSNLGTTLDTPDSLFFTAGQTYFMCAVIGGSPLTSVKPGKEKDVLKPYGSDDGLSHVPSPNPHATYNFEWTRPLTSDVNLKLWDVRFEYNTVLSPVQGQAGEKLDLNIAYATHWTKLDVAKVVNAAADDHRVVTFTKKGLRFRPIGNILALQLGNLTGQDVPIDALKVNFDSGYETLAFGGQLSLTMDLVRGASITDGAKPDFFGGVYLEGDYSPTGSADSRFSLSNKPVLKANQTKQYTYYIWVPMSLDGLVSFTFEKDGQPINLPVRIPVGTRWLQQIRLNSLEETGKGYGQIFPLEINIKN